MLSSTSHDLAQQMFVSGHRAHLMLFVNINKRKVTRFLKTFEPGVSFFSWWISACWFLKRWAWMPQRWLFQIMKSSNYLKPFFMATVTVTTFIIMLTYLGTTRLTRDLTCNKSKNYPMALTWMLPPADLTKLKIYSLHSYQK